MSNDIEQYDDSYSGQELVEFDGDFADQQGQSLIDNVYPIMRRWPIVALIFLVVLGVGAPIVWFLNEPKYETEGAIRISQVVNPIIYESGDNNLGNYENFMNSQAELMGSNVVLNRVADVLVGKGLYLFSGTDNPLLTLRSAVNKGNIDIRPKRGTEFIKISTASDYPSQAEQVVNAFINSYMDVAVSQESRTNEQRMAILEEKRSELANKMDMQRRGIRTLAEEFGTTGLTSRQEIDLQRLGSLQDTLTGIEIKRISLEAQIQLQEGGEPEDLTATEFIKRRNNLLNNDLMIQTLIQNINQYEELIAIGEQTMTANNPDLKRRRELLEVWKERLAERKEEVLKDFNEDFKEQMAENQKLKLAELKTELDRTKQFEENIREQWEKQNKAVIELGRKQLMIDDQKEQLDRTKRIYEEVSRRIEELNIELQRQPRISLAYYASSVPAPSRRIKMLAAVAMGAAALGVGVAFLLSKMDKSLHVPDDIVKRVGVRIIGTTTDHREIDKPLLNQALEDDYKTIRANLGLMDETDSNKIIVVTSPGVRDGKTTFSINFAISMANSGKNVLLIDGDLRKPDIADAMDLPAGSRGLQDYLFGSSIEDSVTVHGSSGVNVLASDERNASDSLDILGRKFTVEAIRKLRDSYDRIIIDSPPVLACSDALLWAKMADGVILTSFAEKTSSPDLRESTKRLQDIGVKVIGSVLHNVKSSRGYNRYGYGYGYGYGYSSSSRRKQDKKVKSARRFLIGSGSGESSQREGNG